MIEHLSISTATTGMIKRYCLKSLKRHLDDIATIPAFYDLLTQSPALSQSVISFLYDELQERANLGLTACLCIMLLDGSVLIGRMRSMNIFRYSEHACLIIVERYFVKQMGT